MTDLEKIEFKRLRFCLALTTTFLVQFINDPSDPRHVSEAILEFNRNAQTLKEVKPK